MHQHTVGYPPGATAILVDTAPDINSLRNRVDPRPVGSPTHDDSPPALVGPRLSPPDVGAIDYYLTETHGPSHQGAGRDG